jgi:hypothetical protein
MLSAVRYPEISKAGTAKLLPSPVFQFKTVPGLTAGAMAGTASGGTIVWARTPAAMAKSRRAAAVR